MSSDDRVARAPKKRVYDSGLRQERARQNRDRIIAAAERRFLRDGYAGTTIAAIAHDAEVSADTMYKTFGNKPGLVRALRIKALEGDGPVRAERRSNEMQALETDSRTIVRAWGALTTEVMPKVGPILLLVRDAAASDDDGKSLLAEMDADRLRRMTANARRLRSSGHLRSGISVSQAAEILWTYSSPELYELLVLRRGWALERYGDFITSAMIDALL